MRFSESFIKLLFLLTATLMITVSCIMSSNPAYYTPTSDCHIVKRGETLSSIGQKYDLSVEKLKLFNNLNSDVIFPGQKIYLQPRLSRKREYVTVRPIPASGYHIVLSRQKITTIAKMYDVSLIDLLNFNNLSSFELKTGQKIYLKEDNYSDYKVQPEESINENKISEITPVEKVVEKPVEKVKKKETVKSNASKKFTPLNGDVTSEFGLRNGKPHKGIDISAPMGTPILAALPGKVAYVGNQRGYGNVVILEHNDFIMTVYAHNEANLVREGDDVAGGQPIATLGDSGSTTGPHLHFEYRVKGVARNPRELFPDF